MTSRKDDGVGVRDDADRRVGTLQLGKGAVIMLATIEVEGKTVILLSGACVEAEGEAAVIAEPEKLYAAARRDPDAVAFGYLQGRWIAAA